MTLEQLPDDSKGKLRELLAGIAEALSATKSPHRAAISDSSMRDWSARHAPMGGGTLRARVKPPFAYDRQTLSTLHRCLLESGNGVLYGIVVHGQRPDAKSAWRLTPKLVWRHEYDRIARSRQPIDAEIEQRLRLLAANTDWEWLQFGRDRFEKEPEVIRKTRSGVERLSPDADLLELLNRAEALYASAGLTLAISRWTLESGGFEFGEIVE